MQPSTRYAVVAIVLCLIGLGIYSYLTKPGPPDQALIEQQIVAALSASNAGSTQSLMDVVSDKYKDSDGLTKDDIRERLVQVYSRTHDLHFRVSTPIIEVNGNTATSDCTLIIDDRGDGQQDLSRTVHVVWEREHGRKWFFIPTTIWRATSSDLTVPSEFD